MDTNQEKFICSRSRTRELVTSVKCSPNSRSLSGWTGGFPFPASSPLSLDTPAEALPLADPRGDRTLSYTTSPHPKTSVPTSVLERAWTRSWEVWSQ